MLQIRIFSAQKLQILKLEGFIYKQSAKSFKVDIHDFCHQFSVKYRHSISFCSLIKVLINVQKKVIMVSHGVKLTFDLLDIQYNVPPLSFYPFRHLWEVLS